MHFKMSSANCFNLDHFKILSSGNELKECFRGNTGISLSVHPCVVVFMSFHVQNTSNFVSQTRRTVFHQLYQNFAHTLIL